MDKSITKALQKSDIDNLAKEARDFAYSKVSARDRVLSGIVIRDPSEDRVTHAPITLLPSPVPRACYDQACSVQTHINMLIHHVAHDTDFLRHCLAKTVEVDDFTRRLWDVYQTVLSEGVTQPVSLAILRSDYMLDTGVNSSAEWTAVQLKQIEINTIAAGMPGLAPKVTECHRFILEELGLPEKAQVVPDNTALESVVSGIVTAWKLYQQPKAVFLMLIYEAEINIYDQRCLQYAIRKQDPQIRVIRRSLREIGDRATLTDDKRLIIDGLEVAIVYKRSCYSPRDFTSQQDWDTLLLVERSRAIKCPSVNYHLAGTKKVQQELARPGVVERYLRDPESAKLVTDTFAGLYSLDQTAESDALIHRVLAEPSKFVLKPQREGGGNNTFGDDIPPLLNAIKNSEERNAYIVMDRVHPASSMNYTVRSGQGVMKENLVGELGVFGTLVATATQVRHNRQDGYLLRSKSPDTDEGGIMQGLSFIDSPYLI